MPSVAWANVFWAPKGLNLCRIAGAVVVFSFLRSFCIGEVARELCWDRRRLDDHQPPGALRAREPAVAGARCERRRARVVALSSSGHKRSGMRWDDPQFETTPYDKWDAYGQAKTADSLFAVELDRLGAPHGVRAFAAHPGGIMTPLQRHLPREEMVAAGWMTEDGVVNSRFKSPEQGAATATWAATSALLDGMGGVYCEDADIAEPTDPSSPDARIAGVDAHAIDPDDAKRLWAYSVELTGVNAFA